MANLPTVPNWMVEAPAAYRDKLSKMSDRELDRVAHRTSDFWNQCFSETEDARHALNLLERRATKARHRMLAASEEQARRKERKVYDETGVKEARAAEAARLSILEADKAWYRKRREKRGISGREVK
jgi:hypothetical protein